MNRIKESFDNSTRCIRRAHLLNDRLHRWLFKLLPGKVIVNCDRLPYLYRWYLIKTRFLGVFIHRFARSDEDRALHDHPWNFIVIPLWQGYLEHSDRGVRRVLPIIGTRIRKATYRHRVELVEGRHAWSLFVRFRYRRTWGFWPAGVFVNWRKWWNDLCED